MCKSVVDYKLNSLGGLQPRVLFSGMPKRSYLSHSVRVFSALGEYMATESICKKMEEVKKKI